MSTGTGNTENKNAKEIQMIEKFTPERVDAVLGLTKTQLCKALFPNENDWKHFTDGYGGFTNKKDPLMKTKGTYVEGIVKWLKAVKVNGYEMTSTYRQPTPKGRHFVNGMGFQRCKAELRGFLQEIPEGTYVEGIPSGKTHLESENTLTKKTHLTVDYDMINAHPCVLLYMCNTLECLKNEQTVYLKQYVDDRESILERECISKHTVLKTMNKDRVNNIKSAWLQRFHKELRPIKDIVYAQFQQEFVLDKARKNLKSQVLNQLICRYENQILMEACTAVRNFNGVVSTYTFDGFQADTLSGVLTLNKYTKTYGIEWAEKPYGSIDLSQFAAENEEAAALWTLVDGNILDFSGSEYDVVKTEFEKTHFKVMNPLSFCTIDMVDGDPKVLRYPLHTFKAAYMNLLYSEEEYDAKRDDYTTKKKPFVDKWVRDPEMRQYKRLGFLPPPLECPKTTYNLFTGFKYQRWDPDLECESFDFENNVFIRQLRRLAGDEGTEEVLEYFLNYFAHLLQKPGELPEVAIGLRSVEGVGKNLFFEGFGNNVLGRKYVLSTSNPKDILDKFNHRDEKFMINWDEASGKDTIASENQIKGCITEKDFWWQTKGVDGVQLPNFNRMAFFANYDNLLKVSPTDRRFQLVECQRLPLNEIPGEVDALLDAFADPAKLKPFVTHLLNRDISKWVANKTRVQTGFYDALASKNVDKYQSFVKKLLFDNRETDHIYWTQPVKKVDVWLQFEKYCNKQGWDEGSSKMFYRKLNAMDGIDNKKTTYERKQWRCFTIDRGNLISYLASKKVRVLDEVEKEALFNDEEGEVFVGDDPDLDPDRDSSDSEEE